MIIGNYFSKIYPLFKDKEDDHLELIGISLSTVKASLGDEFALAIVSEYLKVPMKSQNFNISTTMSAFFLINYKIPIPTVLKMLRIFENGLSDKQWHKQICSVTHSCMRNISNDLRKGIPLKQIFGKTLSFYKYPELQR